MLYLRECWVYTSIIWNSSKWEKICLFFIYLPIWPCMWINVYSSVFILYSVLYFNSTLLSGLFQSWSLGALFVGSFWHFCGVFSLAVSIFWCSKILQDHLYICCLSPRIRHFLFPFLKSDRRNQGTGTRCACWYWHVIAARIS